MMESYPLGEGHFNRTFYLFFAELKAMRYWVIAQCCMVQDPRAQDFTEEILEATIARMKDDKDYEAKGRNQPPLVVERVNDDKDNEGDDDEAIDDEGEEPAPIL